MIVAVKPFPNPVIVEFDPNHPPTDPPLADDEEADAGPTFMIAAARPGLLLEPSYDPATQKASVKITVSTPITVEVSATSTIRLPTNANQALKDHEQGHIDLARYEYDKFAKKKIEDAYRTLKGMMFTGSGMGDRTAAIRAARQEVAQKLNDEIIRRRTIAGESLEKQNKLLNKKYDRLTDHGGGSSNDLSSGQPLVTASGVYLAKFEWDFFRDIPDLWKDEPPGLRKHRSGILDPAAVFFDAEQSLLSFGGDMIIDDALSPIDALLGRCRIEIDPLVWIGVQEDGSIHLSDSALRIIDTINGDVLLDAYLLDVSYRGFDGPDDAGRIVAGLDIPPDFAGGINNSIGSEFLAGIGAARSSGQLTNFYFQPKGKLVSFDGAVVIPPDGMTGRLILGMPVPEPTTRWLHLSVIGALSARRRSHRGRAVRHGLAQRG